MNGVSGNKQTNLVYTPLYLHNTGSIYWHVDLVGMQTVYSHEQTVVVPYNCSRCLLSVVKTCILLSGAFQTDFCGNADLYRTNRHANRDLVDYSKLTACFPSIGLAALSKCSTLLEAQM